MKQKKDKIIFLTVTFCIILVIISFAVLLTVFSKKINKKNENAVVIENRKKANDKEYVQSQMMDYLENRYHEKFVKKYYEFSNGGWGGTYFHMDAYPKGKEDDEHTFSVWGNFDEDGNLVYSDSYPYLRLNKDMTEHFRPFIEKYYDKYLYYDVDFGNLNSFDSRLPLNISAEDFLKLDDSEGYRNPDLYLHLQVESQKDFNYDVLESLAKTLQENRFRGHFTFSLFEINEQKACKSYTFNIYKDRIEISGRIDYRPPSK